MSQITQDDVQAAMRLVAEAKKQTEQEILDFIQKSVNNFYRKTGIAISDVYVDTTTAKDLNGKTMSYVTDVRCSTYPIYSGYDY